MSLLSLLNILEADEIFRKAAQAYAAEACRTKETAFASLVDLGFYTNSGRLSNYYR